MILQQVVITTKDTALAIIAQLIRCVFPWQLSISNNPSNHLTHACINLPGALQQLLHSRHFPTNKVLREDFLGSSYELRRTPKAVPALWTSGRSTFIESNQHRPVDLKTNHLTSFLTFIQIFRNGGLLTPYARPLENWSKWAWRKTWHFVLPNW